MSIVHVQDPRLAADLAELLSGVDRFALDLEAAGFHRYSDRMCLIQVSTRDSTWIVDPFAFDVAEALGPILEDPSIEKVMHGSDFDVRLLHRDLGVSLEGLFDTQAAASLLGERALGLASLVQKHLGVKLSKKHQRADWAQRPLPDEMLEYAADDTRHLLPLADILRRRLDEAGRTAWAENECRELETVRWDENSPADPVTTVKGARDLSPRELECLREALEWRDGIARERDRAPFRIAGDKALLEVVVRRPETVPELEGIRGISRSIANAKGRDLLERLRAVDEKASSVLRAYPSTGPESRRPSPDVEERTRRLRSVRNRRAEELGIDRGTLLPNAMLEEIAKELPSSLEALERIPGVKDWQVEAAGEAVIDALAAEEAA